MNEFEAYQKSTLILGIFGVIIFWVMFFSISSIYMPVYERLSAYTLIIWSFLTGMYLLKN